MSSGFKTQYFLGANSPGGFYSLYENLFHAETDNALYILKGGPGCGKSSFMRTIAQGLEEKGYTVEYILCSGDPDSLDGIFIPKLRTGFVDGTAPHVIEPKYPAVSEQYINLGSFYNAEALKEKKAEIVEINRLYKALYAKAYGFLAAVASILGKLYENIVDDSIYRTIEKRARGIITREFKKTGRPQGKATYRFISAFTCKGSIFFADTIKALSMRVCTIDNDLGLAHSLLSLLAQAAMAQGYDIILCPNPMFPEKTDHLLIPELSLAFVSQTSHVPYPGHAYKHMRLDALADKDKLRHARAHLRSSKKIAGRLLQEAENTLAEAKALHDQLEGLYNPHVNFEGVYAAAENYLNLLLKENQA